MLGKFEFYVFILKNKIRLGCDCRLNHKIIDFTIRLCYNQKSYIKLKKRIAGKALWIWGRSLRDKQRIRFEGMGWGNYALPALICPAGQMIFGMEILENTLIQTGTKFRGSLQKGRIKQWARKKTRNSSGGHSPRFWRQFFLF